jgi:hypothetical protein
MSKAWIQDNGMTAAVNREIDLISRLKHRNVVELIEVSARMCAPASATRHRPAEQCTQHTSGAAATGRLAHT